MLPLNRSICGVFARAMGRRAAAGVGRGREEVRMCNRQRECQKERDGMSMCVCDF